MDADAGCRYVVARWPPFPSKRRYAMGFPTLMAAVATVLLTAGPPREGTVKGEVAGLAGTWKCTSGDADGYRAPAATVARTRLIIRADGTYCNQEDGKTTCSGIYTVHKGPEAWAINFHCHEGRL